MIKLTIYVNYVNKRKPLDYRMRQRNSGWFKQQLTQAFQDVTSSLKTSYVSNTTSVCPTWSPSQDSVILLQSESNGSSSSESSDLEGADLHIFHKEKLCSLLKSVKSTIESDDAAENEMDKDRLFFFPKKKSSVFPDHPLLKQALGSDLQHPKKRVDVGARFESIYVLDPSTLADRESPPKVELVVARLAKRSVFHPEESSLLRDSMEKDGFST